jgi:hypothetical protein
VTGGDGQLLDDAAAFGGDKGGKDNGKSKSKSKSRTSFFKHSASSPEAHESVCTSTISATLAPVWDESFTLGFHDSKDNCLQMNVWDWDNTLAKSFVGQHVIQLKDFPATAPGAAEGSKFVYEGWFHLWDKRNKIRVRGSVYLRIFLERNMVPLKLPSPSASKQELAILESFAKDQRWRIIKGILEMRTLLQEQGIDRTASVQDYVVGCEPSHAAYRLLSNSKDVTVFTGRYVYVCVVLCVVCMCAWLSYVSYKYMCVYSAGTSGTRVRRKWICLHGSRATSTTCT